MPPVTRSQTKPVPTAEEIAAAAAAKAVAIAAASEPVKKPKKAPATKKPVAKKATKKASATTDADPSSTEPTEPAPKKRKARHSFTLVTEIIYWDFDTEQEDDERESFTGTKAAANRYFKKYLKHLKSKDRGGFGRRDNTIGRLDRDENGLFTYEYSDLPEGREGLKEIMDLKMYLEMDAEDKRVEDDEPDTSSEFGG